MKLNVLSRKIHYWITVFVALPVLVIVATGILLQLKKQADWVQPPEQRGTGTTPEIGLEEILASASSVNGLEVSGWDDVNRMDFRPGRGLVKVWLRSGHEVQVDLGTGRVLHAAYRRSDLIESIHDGSFFAGNVSRFGLFLPAGICLLVMWVTGLWMFWQPFSARRKARPARR